MKLVLDTNILVSALLTPYGHPAQLLHLILVGKISLVLNDQIYAEYKTVLARPKFMFNQERVQELLGFITDEAEFIISLPLKIVIPDLKDLVFLEVVVAADADALITGNQKHFPRETTKGLGITVYSPAQFFDFWPSKQDVARPQP